MSSAGSVGSSVARAGQRGVRPLGCPSARECHPSYSFLGLALGSRRSDNWEMRWRFASALAVFAVALALVLSWSLGVFRAASGVASGGRKPPEGYGKGWEKEMFRLYRGTKGYQQAVACLR
jgi:hypothetical protein